MTGSQIKTRDRVRDLGEVYTNEREVKSMMDLVMDEGYKISSRFLEPACGNGNFLEEILKRKLETVLKVSNGQKNFEYNIIKSISSIYGIDICLDNVIESRERMVHIIKSFYSMNRNTNITNEGFYESIEYILSKNIFKGDFINGEKDSEGRPLIIFSEFTSRNKDKKYHITEKLFSMTSMKENNPTSLFDYEPIAYNEIFKNKTKKDLNSVHKDLNRVSNNQLKKQGSLR